MLLQALYCLGDLISDHAKAQEAVAGAVVTYQTPRLPLLQAALRAAVHAADARERSGAVHVIASFCRGNPDGQSTLASTIAPSGEGRYSMQPCFASCSSVV